MSKNRIEHSFAKGVLIITIGMFFVKVFGALFKIPLVHILGGEGNGYFLAAYNLYNPIYALASAGLPIAISRMIAEAVKEKRFRDVKKIHKLSIPIFFVMAIFGFVLMIFCAFVSAKISKMPGALYSMLMLAPTLLFSCLISIYKGYYQGLKNMIPTAITEVIEAAGKVVFGIGFAYFVLKYLSNEYEKFGTIFGKYCENEVFARGLIIQYSASAAVFGICTAALAGLIGIFFIHKFNGEVITAEEIKNSPKEKNTKEIINNILKISVPVGLGAIILNLAGYVDSVLISMRLSDIMDICPETLLRVYPRLIPSDTIARGTTHAFLTGCFAIMSYIVMMVPTISQGLAISALPSVTTAWVGGISREIKKSIETVLKTTAIVAFPSGIGLAVLSQPIVNLVYNSFSNSCETGKIFIASKIMIIAAIAIIFVTICTPVCSMLQAVGRADLPVKILSLGVLAKVILNYILVGIPEINIQGASIGTLVCYFFICVVSILCLQKEAKVKINFFNTIIKPLFCAVCCGIFAYLFYEFFSRTIGPKVGTIGAIGFAGIIYLILILMTKTAKIRLIRLPS